LLRTATNITINARKLSKIVEVLGVALNVYLQKKIEILENNSILRCDL